MSTCMPEISCPAPTLAPSFPLNRSNSCTLCRSGSFAPSNRRSHFGVAERLGHDHRDVARDRRILVDFLEARSPLAQMRRVGSRSICATNTGAAAPSCVARALRQLPGQPDHLIAGRDLGREREGRMLCAAKAELRNAQRLDRALEIEEIELPLRRSRANAARSPPRRRRASRTRAAPSHPAEGRCGRARRAGRCVAPMFWLRASTSSNPAHEARPQRDVIFAQRILQLDGAARATCSHRRARSAPRCAPRTSRARRAAAAVRSRNRARDQPRFAA